MFGIGAIDLLRSSVVRTCVKQRYPWLRRNAALCGALTLACVARAQQQTALDQLINTLCNNELAVSQAPGLVIGTSFETQSVVVRGYGKIKQSDAAAPNGNTVFPIGQLSAALTAFGLMELVDEKKIALTDPASKYLPELPKAWKAVTVQMFLAQASGIPNFRKGLEGSEFKADTWLDALDRTEIEPMAFLPGAQQKYEAGNYAIVGKLIEKVSGKPYLTFMKEKVFAPLGMTRTGVKVADNVAAGYNIPPKATPREASFSVPDYMVPSEGLTSTVNDLLKWEQAMYSAKLLTKPTYKEMFTLFPVASTGHGRFVLGWQARTFGKDGVVDAGGVVQGYASRMVIDLTRGVAAVALRNSSGGKDSLDELCSQILRQGMGAGTTPRTNPPANRPGHPHIRF